MTQHQPDNEYTDGGRLIVIGKIARAHGIRGEVNVTPLSNIPGRLKSVDNVIIETSDGQCFKRTVKTARGGGVAVILKFDSIDTRDEAEALRGAYISIDEADAPPLEEGSFYSHELIGMSVIDTDGNHVGTIVGLEAYPASDVLIIESDCGIVQIPAVRDFVQSVDPLTRQMIVRPLADMTGSVSGSE